MIGGVYMGTKYRKKYGPLLISEDGKAIKRLFLYSIGYGVLVGFPIMFLNQYFVERINIYISIFLAITAIPLFGMNMIGAFALGRLLNRNLDE